MLLLLVLTMKISRPQFSVYSVTALIPLIAAVFFTLGYSNPELLISHYLIPEQQDKAALILIQLLIVLFLVAVALKISDVLEESRCRTEPGKRDEGISRAIATLWGFFWGLTYLPIAFAFLLSGVWLGVASGVVGIIIGLSAAVALSTVTARLVDAVGRVLARRIVEFATKQFGGF